MGTQNSSKIHLVIGLVPPSLCESQLPSVVLSRWFRFSALVNRFSAFSPFDPLPPDPCLCLTPLSWHSLCSGAIPSVALDSFQSNSPVCRAGILVSFSVPLQVSWDLFTTFPPAAGNHFPTCCLSAAGGKMVWPLYSGLHAQKSPGWV